MGMNDRTNEQKEAKKAKNKAKTAQKARAHYEEVRIARGDRKAFRERMPDSDTLLDNLATAVEADELSFCVGPSHDGTCLQVSLHDNTLGYVSRVYLTARHSEFLTALAVLLHGYVTIFEGLPPHPQDNVDDYEW